MESGKAAAVDERDADEEPVLTDRNRKSEMFVRLYSIRDFDNYGIVC